MRWLRTDSVFSVVLLLAILPTVMWSFEKSAWGLHNDLAADPASGLSRLSSRLGDGFSSKYVLNFLVRRATAIWALFALFVAGAAFSRYRRVRLHRGALLAAMTAALYGTGLFAVYMSTPHDILPFYLLTSASRTMATASMAMLVSIFFLMSGLEVSAARQSERGPDTTGQFTQ
jgi:hypothetical protein